MEPRRLFLTLSRPLETILRFHGPDRLMLWTDLIPHPLRGYAKRSPVSGLLHFFALGIPLSLSVYSVSFPHPSQPAQVALYPPNPLRASALEGDPGESSIVFISERVRGGDHVLVPGTEWPHWGQREQREREPRFWSSPPSGGATSWEFFFVFAPGSTWFVGFIYAHPVCREWRWVAVWWTRKELCRQGRFKLYYSLL